MTQPLRYNEWQLPNFSSFLPHLLITPAIWATLAPFSSTLGIVVGAAFTVVTVAMRFLMAKRIQVSNEVLSLGTARLPLNIVKSAELIAKEDQFFARGALLDARAFLCYKSGLPDLVRINISDKNDPTPYALVSSRRGAELVALLNS
ncbi:MAG: hypothetical protein RLZZ164_1082 [Actinomycetota bacterium]